MSTDISKNDKRTPFFVGALILLAIINVILVYLMMQNKQDSIKKDDIIAEKNVEIGTTSAKLDSISQQLDIRIAEVKRKDGDYQALLEIKEQLLRDKEGLKNASESTIRSYQEKIKMYEGLLMKKDEELEKYKGIITEQNQEINKTKTEKTKLIDSIGNVQKAKQELEATVAKAAVLKAETIKMVFYSDVGKERFDEGKGIKASLVDKIKATFKIADNPAAKIETKQIYMRVIEPSGAVLVGAEGGRFKDADRKDINYTMMQQILFDNSRQSVTFNFKKGSEYKKGTHKVEIYCEGNLIGTQSFVVK